MPTRRQAGEESGRARYSYRLRVSSTALTGLSAEWARCRWVGNACVTMSRKAHDLNKSATDMRTCGPARLDKMLTEARTALGWLREGSSVPQQQTIRDFGESRAKAFKDIKAKLPVRQRAGMPRTKRKRDALPSLNHTRRGFRLKDGRPHLAGGIALTVVWSRSLPADPTSVRVYRERLGHGYASFVVETATQPLPATERAIGIDWGVNQTAITTSDAHDLPHAQHGRNAATRLARHQKQMARRKPARGKAASKGYRTAADAAISATRAALTEMARKHGRIVHLVHPARTTMDCAQWGARTKRALPLSERTCACTACGAVSPRDKNSARVMLVRAGLNPAGADGESPPGAPLPEEA